MRKGHVVLLLGLLAWVDPAFAQKLTIHPLTVSIHKSLESWVKPNDVEQILKLASDLLQQSPNNCRVGFKLKDELATFTSAPASIDNEADLELVHRVPAHVKVVRQINYCIRGPEYGLVGCSWRPNNLRKTVIVSTDMMSFGLEHMVLAHEYGHVAGLLHRDDPRGEALMTPCGIDADRYRINKDECHHFVAGAVTQYPPGLGYACPTDASRQRTDQIGGVLLRSPSPCCRSVARPDDAKAPLPARRRAEREARPYRCAEIKRHPGISSFHSARSCVTTVDGQ